MIIDPSHFCPFLVKYWKKLYPTNYPSILKILIYSILPNSVFAKKVSISLPILDTMQYVYDNLDQGNVVISFFLDFSKAFDCVDHNLLFEKMNVYGVDSVA